MLLTIDPVGLVRCIYDEAIDLGTLGTLSISRASHVEPDAQVPKVVELGPLQEHRFLEARQLPARRECIRRARADESP